MTLTELSYYSRKMLPFAAFGFLLMVIFILSVQIMLAMLSRPAPVNPYDIAFGKLPPIALEKGVDLPDPTYQLDTLNGKAELQDEQGAGRTATAAAHIYTLLMPEISTTFKTKVTLLGRNLGFSQTALDNAVREGTTTTVVEGEKKLSLDIRNFNFSFADPIASYGGVMKDAETIMGDATNHLVTMNNYPEELAQGERKITYLFFDDKTGQYSVLTKDRIADANAYEVDFYRSAIDSAPVYTPQFIKSPTFVLLTYPSGGKPHILKSQVAFFPKTDVKVGVYPVKSVEEAYQELQDHKGRVVYYDPTQSTLNVQKISFGYYDTSVYQQYLQPVYLFTDQKESFVAYVPAVSNMYVASDEASISSATTTSSEATPE